MRVVWIRFRRFQIILKPSSFSRGCSSERHRAQKCHAFRSTLTQTNKNPRWHFPSVKILFETQPLQPFLVDYRVNKTLAWAVLFQMITSSERDRRAVALLTTKSFSFFWKLPPTDACSDLFLSVLLPWSAMQNPALLLLIDCSSLLARCFAVYSYCSTTAPFMPFFAVLLVSLLYFFDLSGSLVFSVLSRAQPWSAPCLSVIYAVRALRCSTLLYSNSFCAPTVVHPRSSGGLSSVFLCLFLLKRFRRRKDSSCLLVRDRTSVLGQTIHHMHLRTGAAHALPIQNYWNHQ